ncbi:MAG: hypothetical protein KC944_18135 [Candidatus Omnitrophica bacterium]|nr:hypothetical protein [Candidatus Omnitrophota bacterium]
MLNRIKVLCLLTLSLAVCSATFADTFTVRKDGSGNFTTIQAALESLDYNNGVNDVILIGPGVYDQQFTANGDAGADSVRYPNVFNMTLATVEAAYASHPDSLTLKGENPNDPPVLTYISGADKTQQPYGMFPSDPSDFFEAGLVHCGNNVTYENVDIRHGSLGYCMNGMSAGTVFEDCLFTNGTTASQGYDDFWDFNNNINITSAVNANIGADNEYTFNNCIWDGESVIDQSIFGSTAVYFHGFDSFADPNTFYQIGGVAASGCIMRNWGDNIFQPRGREQKDRGIAYLTIEDCFSQNIPRVATMHGAMETGLVNRCVFDISGGDDAIELSDRDGGLYATAIIANNIISGTSASNRSLRLRPNDTAGRTIIQTANWSVVNNTFYGYNGAGILTDGDVGLAGSSCTMTIANNILHGDGGGAAIGVNHTATATGGTLTINLVNNGFFGNGGGDVVGTVSSNTGAVNADPAYSDGTALSIPADTNWGVKPVQQLNPTGAYLGGGNDAAYSAIAGTVGAQDVDGSNPRTGGGDGIDIGAQENEPVAVLDWNVY